VKKLAIVLLFVMGCTRQVAVGSPEPSAPGAASPREAIEKFMAAGKAQDLEAFANIWGTSSGPVRSTMSRDQWETRAIILIRCLKHDSYRVLGEAPAAGGERVLAVEVVYGDLTATTNFVVTRGPGDRWYVRQFDNQALQRICSAY
jgi:hypothetical protein